MRESLITQAEAIRMFPHIDFTRPDLPALCISGRVLFWIDELDIFLGVFVNEAGAD